LGSPWRIYDAAVVVIPAAGAVTLDDVVVPVVADQLEVLPGVVDPAVMLPEPFAVLP
jgi:hypothetical protein